LNLCYEAVAVSISPGKIMMKSSTPAGSRFTALTFSIQRYSIQDGPGIRTTVFLKGCPLKCGWCSNPESQNPYPEIMAREIKCQGCGTCIEVCENGAVSLQEGRVHIDRDSCQLCMSCVKACPNGALETTGEYQSLDAILQEVERDALFYKNSGGGVTLSGGEPLMQSEFAAEFMKRCREKGLSTALDTCGHARWEVFETVLENTDLVLFDLKHLDPELHLQSTTVRNDLILENLQRVAASGLARLWIRIPLIGGYNDAADYLQQLARTIREMPVEKISLLAYHEWGKPKYQFLGRTYPAGNCLPVSEERVTELKEVMEAEGIAVTIGY